MVEVLKRVLLFVAIGAVLGNAVTMLLAPQALAWFQTPGVGSALCNCGEVSRQTAESLIRAQLLGMLTGAIVCGIAGELLARVWAARKLRAQTLTADQASAAVDPVAHDPPAPAE